MTNTGRQADCRVNVTMPSDVLDVWYRKLWIFAHERFVDHNLGGGYPELGSESNPIQGQFEGKPDIYHSLHAALIPLVGRPSKIFDALMSAGPGVDWRDDEDEMKGWADINSTRTVYLLYSLARYLNS